MIELNKKFESDDEAAIYFARVIGNYCLKVGKCENCVFGLDMGDGVKNACFLTSRYLPCTWNSLMRRCGIIKREVNDEQANNILMDIILEEDAKQASIPYSIKKSKSEKTCLNCGTSECELGNRARWGFCGNWTERR